MSRSPPLWDTSRTPPVTVLDASAVVELALASSVGRQVHSLTLNQDQLAAPEMMEIEFLHALKRLVRAGQMSEHRAKEAMDFIADLPISRHRHGPLRKRIWELAKGLGTYDASYVALAEWLSTGLITCDARLARGVTIVTPDLPCTLVQSQ